MSPDHDEALQEIYRRGNKLRWRFRARIASIGVVAALATAGVVAAGHHDGTAHRTVEAGGRSPSSHVLAENTSARGSTDGSSTGSDDSNSPSGSSGSPSNGTHHASSSSTSTSVGAKGAAAVTSTTLACHNSTDPACGPFHYEPPLPPDRRPTITITPAATPVVGQPVTFEVTVDDPDGQGPGRCGQFNPDAGATTTSTAALSPASTCYQPASVDPAATHGYGAWDPPSTVPGHQQTSYTATYDTPGPHTVSYTTFDVGNCGDKSCPSVTKTVTVDVTPAPTTTAAASSKAR